MLVCFNLVQTRDSRFFLLFQFHRMQKAVMIRRRARSPANPERMPLLWSLPLEEKPSSVVLAGHRTVGMEVEEDISFRAWSFATILPNLVVKEPRNNK